MRENQKVFPIPADALITYKSDIYSIEVYDDRIPYDELDSEKAYIKDNQFYLLKGPKTKNPFDLFNPGIYRGPDGSSFLLECVTKDEKKEFDLYDALVKQNKDQIVTVLKDKDRLYIQTPTSPSRVFRPSVTDQDDILKRGIKEALRQKNLDLSALTHRFPNKNALINFKQALNNPDRPLSILLFERGAEALNLKYSIIIEDIDADSSVGDPLIAPIIVTSEDLLAALIEGKN